MSAGSFAGKLDELQEDGAADCGTGVCLNGHCQPAARPPRPTLLDAYADELLGAQAPWESAEHAFVRVQLLRQLDCPAEALAVTAQLIAREPPAADALLAHGILLGELGQPAAALATLDLFAASDVLGRNRELAAHMARLAEPFRTHPHIGDVRQRGMILAFELVADKTTRTPYPWQQRRGLDVYRHALDRGALLRPLGNVVYFMPPYVITEAELDRLAEIAWECIELVTLDPQPFGDVPPGGGEAFTC